MPGQSFATLYSFQFTDGAYPAAGLIQPVDGDFYGTTSSGGATGGGSVFSLTTGNGVTSLTTLYSFCQVSFCADGADPLAGLVLANNGNFYGTTAEGGNNDGLPGTVYEVTPGGALTTLYDFCNQSQFPNCSDGYYPDTGLLAASDGNFYGTTSQGASSNCGTIFKITPTGALTTLHTFESTDGCIPRAGLIEVKGIIYGAAEGGVGNTGTFFSLTLGGNFTVLTSFSSAEGSGPSGALVYASDGNFYGTAVGGGANGEGTVFKVTPGGTLTTLYSFCSLSNCADGYQPVGGLIQANDGNLYGTTKFGPASQSFGTIFKITLGGALTTLHQFGGADGAVPESVLMQSTDGNLYGTTLSGGDLNCGSNLGCGTVFRLSLGLSPFVETRPSSGKVGAAVTIQGTNLTGATSVTFDGTPAVFTVVSGFEITTTVPAGARTGTVQVKTPGGTLNSNTTFLVTPQVLSFTPTSGPVGTSVTITGVSLTQTLGVGFGDHVPAHFTVNSDTQVTATVPSGARTGPVGIETKGGIGISSKKFTVTP
jgi:uncharacterized repeat protein (TIGR03803 family)